ncbi:MAG: enoyl-CoA hydratase-related protein [Myxococcota bacterium]|nr:enoyl-CoA hydratase-related protein [Myxococcota bacterium]
MIDLSRDGDVFILTMDAGENRWNTTFVRAFDEKLDEISGSSGPAALVTTSSSGKFFSNGLDLEWANAPDDHPEGGDSKVFGAEFMQLMAKIITLPIPTLAAVGGHAFGAGFMLALSHDLRLMRSDRGYLCANEMQIGISIPKPELALFRHKLPANVFYESVQLARRWSGEAALAAGIVQEVAEVGQLLERAKERAAELAPLGENRKVFGRQKETLFGENAPTQLDHGAAHLLRNSGDYDH